MELPLNPTGQGGVNENVVFVCSKDFNYTTSFYILATLRLKTKPSIYPTSNVNVSDQASNSHSPSFLGTWQLTDTV